MAGPGFQRRNFVRLDQRFDSWRVIDMLQRVEAMDGIV